MATTTVHDHREATVFGRRTWTPAQFVAGALGLFLVVMGGVAMARAGLDGSWTDPVVEVLGFDHTALMGAIEVGLGLVLIIVAFATWEVRGWLVGLGLLALAFGLIVLIEPAAFDGSLGVESASGWLYAAMGAGMMAAAWLSPILVTGRTHEVHEEAATVVATPTTVSHSVTTVPNPAAATTVVESRPAPPPVPGRTVAAEGGEQVVVVDR